MSDGIASLQRKLNSAEDLRSVVRTMKALAAASIGQYEKAVQALAGFDRTVELGLGSCLRTGVMVPHAEEGERIDAGELHAIVFGSDQGLVGQFNELVTEFAIQTLAGLPGRPRVWVVGERAQAQLVDAGLEVGGLFPVPSSTKGIAHLVGRIQAECMTHGATPEEVRVYVFHNRPHPGGRYSPVDMRLLPLDTQWQLDLAKVAWPTGIQPEIVGDGTATLRGLIHELFFVSLFRACAESLASENVSRLATMGRAEKNIDELLENLNGTFHRLRQDSIDEELFDVISGYEALSPKES